MAKDITSQPWTFEAVGDFEGVANVGEVDASLNGPVFPHRIYINRVKVKTGSVGGDILINQSDGGLELIDAPSTPADDVLEWEIQAWVKGIYVQTLPAGAKISVFHGVEGN